ncbi:ankyrin repeat-containing domain protein [Nemania sp. FL0031]|nr:ankyrin repeat-containing domain protein [Nemania sp. FL0031]
MCYIYSETFKECGHAGQTRTSFCEIGAGHYCPEKKVDPVKDVAGKCLNCRRKEAQAYRLFGEEAKSVAAQLLVAGYDPIAGQFYGLLFWLLKEPDILATLVEEIRGNLKSYEVIVPEALNTMPKWRKRAKILGPPSSGGGTLVGRSEPTDAVRLDLLDTGREEHRIAALGVHHTLNVLRGARCPDVGAAAKNGHAGVIEKLMPHINPAEVTLDCRTALHWESSQGHMSVVKKLLDGHQSEVGCRSLDGWTPLHWAACSSKRAVIMCRGTQSVQETDNSSTRPRGTLSISGGESRGYEEVTELLLELGADPNVENQEHRTPLHWAAVSGNARIVSLILSKGANASIRNIHDFTPYQFAVKIRRTRPSSIFSPLRAME